MSAASIFTLLYNQQENVKHREKYVGLMEQIDELQGRMDDVTHRLAGLKRDVERLAVAERA
jgi:hypothetical protein